MKRIVIFSHILLFILMVSLQNYAQEKVSPVFLGDKEISTIRTADNAALINNYLLKNVNCPAQAAECCKEGTELVQFTVSKTGELKDFKILNSVCSALDQEVLRVLKNTGGMWQPAVKDGNPVDMTQEVAFMFGDHKQNTIVNYFVQTATRSYHTGNKKLLEKNNPEKALKYYNHAINYMPNDKALLSMRGLCYFEMGDEENARKDWNRIVALGGIAKGLKLDHLAELKGFEEMTLVLHQK